MSRTPEHPSRDSGSYPLSEKYEKSLRLALGASQTVRKDAEEKSGQDMRTVLQRALEAKKDGELRTEDAVELVLDMLYTDGSEEYIKKLLFQLAGTPLGYVQDFRIRGALDAAASRGKFKYLRRMYQKRRRQATASD